MTEQRIEIEVSAFAEFKVSDLWPEGNAPNPVTVEDVWALVNQENPRRLTYDWFFPTPDIHVRVR